MLPQAYPQSYESIGLDVDFHWALLARLEDADAARTACGN